MLNFNQNVKVNTLLHIFAPMLDYSKCTNTTCKARQICSRANYTTVSDYSQSYTHFNFTIEYDKFDCAYYRGKPEDLLLLQIKGLQINRMKNKLKDGNV